MLCYLLLYLFKVLQFSSENNTLLQFSFENNTLLHFSFENNTIYELLLDFSKYLYAISY